MTPPPPARPPESPHSSRVVSPSRKRQRYNAASDAAAEGAETLLREILEKDPTLISGVDWPVAHRAAQLGQVGPTGPGPKWAQMNQSQKGINGPGPKWAKMSQGPNGHKWARDQRLRFRIDSSFHIMTSRGAKNKLVFFPPLRAFDFLPSAAYGKVVLSLKEVGHHARKV